MKEEYICTWEVKPGPSEKTITAKSFTEIRVAIAKLISEHIDMDDCIKDIRNGCNPRFRNAVADFLYTFCHTSNLIQGTNDIPSGDPNDYTKDDVEYVGNACEANDEDDDEYYSKYNFKFEAGDSDFYFRYIGKCEINMSAYFLVKDENADNYSFEGEIFSFEAPSSKKAKDMIIKLDTDIVWGTSAYPVMVLKVLQESNEPLQQADIIWRVNERYNVTIERKAVGRHIDMLKELGYNIEKSKAGFLLVK